MKCRDEFFLNYAVLGCCCCCCASTAPIPSESTSTPFVVVVVAVAVVVVVVVELERNERNNSETVRTLPEGRARATVLPSSAGGRVNYLPIEKSRPLLPFLFNFESK